ncbi:hypothetical protein J3R83DRAFT_12382 [Lanmaoa asiatica]|nr:hypothetical protein J3R83DRAFT_12382 [Lanmaoa asiatica]
MSLMNGRWGLRSKPTEFVAITISQVEAREQTTAREMAETRLTDAQAQISTLEQKLIVESRNQLAAFPKPKVGCSVLPHLSASSILNKHQSSSNTVPPPAEEAQSDEELGAASPSTSTMPTKVKDKSSKPASTSKPSSGRPADAPAKPRPKPRPVKKPDPIPELQDSDIEILDAPFVPSAAPEQNAKAKGKQKVAHDNDIASDIEMGEVRKHKKKGKTKDAEKEAETREPTKAKVKPKKTSPSSEADETHPKAKGKVNSRKRTSPDPPKKSKAKPAQPKEDSEDAAAAEPDAVPKKKKRKINLFGGSQPATFDWNSLGQVFLFPLNI